ncbi:MAG: toxin-antitoxin system HicB family antitoxin [Chthoniobacteraceae bacterium]
MSRYLSLRINAKVGERIAAHAKELQWSSNQFAEKAIEAVCDIIEKPESRNLPDFITMIDALHAHQKAPVPLKSSKSPK